MSHPSDSVFWKNFALLVGALIALTFVLFVVAQIMAAKIPQEGLAQLKDKAAQEQTMASRIRPAGQLKLASGAGGEVMNALIPAANAAGGGEATYKATCQVCHLAGVAGAPKYGDKAAWKDRIAQGKPTLYERAIKGFQGKVGFMPAKGGNASVSDADVKAAVDYMLEGSQ
jgi:cytochrome c5